MISKFGTWLFQSTPSARRATPITKPCSSKDFVFQSTPSARRATTSETSALSLLKYFNPRPPRGGRLIALHKHGFPVVFQSTPSARRATPRSAAETKKPEYFNPRPPRGGRLITASFSRTSKIYFNPRPPRGGRRRASTSAKTRKPISIHALREEGDTINQLRQAFQVQFQSTPSARRATREGHGADGWVLFQSTPSARRATRYRKDPLLFFKISIHALREEGDVVPLEAVYGRSDFNPRPPRGGRQQKQRKNPPLLFHYTRLCTI